MQPTDIVTIRRLPDGEKQAARLADRSAERLTLYLERASNVLKAGMLVEIEARGGFYLCALTTVATDGAISVVVEHFVDRAALLELERSWKSASYVA